MSRPKGTTEAGKKAISKWKETMLARYGEEGLHNMMSEMGRRGGQNGHTGGFFANPELAKRAGQKGGKISRRGAAKK